MRFFRICAAALSAAIVAVLGTSLLAAASAETYRVLYSFCHGKRCAQNSSSLIEDQDGDIFGTTLAGGRRRRGTIFELTPGRGGYKYQGIYGFCAQLNCIDGSLPYAPLIVDTSGNLYGTAKRGGDRNDGVIFELAAAQAGRRTLQILYSFCRNGGICSDGKHPLTGLAYSGQETGALYDGASPLFGTTNGGGKHRQGAAYEIRPEDGSWTYRTIYSFCSVGDCRDGVRPSALIEDASGNLFGTTYIGGNAKYGGTAFELSFANNKWTQTVLHEFCSRKACADGNRPNGGLAMDSSGDLYGVTLGGGARDTCPEQANRGCGVVYLIEPNGARSTEKVLYTFCEEADCPDGYFPLGTPALDPKGNIYGTTWLGGENSYGTLFQLDGPTLHDVYQFCDCAGGGLPATGVIRDQNGNLFGTTTFAGANGDGVIYEFSP